MASRLLYSSARSRLPSRCLGATCAEVLSQGVPSAQQQQQQPQYYQHNNQHQHRNFAVHRNTKKFNKKDNPFKILKISEEAPYQDAKASFLKIAMSAHPDTANAETEEEKAQLRDTFITARKAFERLVEAPDGSILLQEEVEEIPDFDQWFRQETGHDSPFQFMDFETMKEVAEMTDEIGGGLDRDGGM